MRPSVIIEPGTFWDLRMAKNGLDCKNKKLQESLGK